MSNSGKQPTVFVGMHVPGLIESWCLPAFGNSSPVLKGRYGLEAVSREQRLTTPSGHSDVETLSRLRESGLDFVFN